jgi:hypothetical protein
VLLRPLKVVACVLLTPFLVFGGMLLSPLLFAGVIGLVIVRQIAYTVSRYRARTARVGAVLVSHGHDGDCIRATVLCALGAGPGAVLLEAINDEAVFVVNIVDARRLVQGMECGDPVLPGPLVVEWPGLVAVVARVAAVRVDMVCDMRANRWGRSEAEVEAMRAQAVWTLQRPVRLVQRAWRAHVRRRLRWAVGVVEGAALAALYRPGGAGYQDAERRWVAAAAVAGGVEGGVEEGALV